MVSINRHIYFLYYFVVFAFPPAFGGDAASCLEVELAVFLLDEAYHDSAVQLSVGIMPHDAGVEAPAVVFGLGDDFYGFGLGGAGDGAGRKQAEDDVAQVCGVVFGQGAAYLG